jgi:hypothetical protein
LITQAKITSIQYDLGETFDDGYEALRNTYLMSRGDDDVRGTEGTAKTTDLATEQPPDLLDDDDVRGTEGTAKTTDSATEQPPDLLDDDDVRGTEGTAKTTDSATEQPPDLLD